MARLLFFLLGLLASVNLSLQQSECDATRLCPIGCCSSAGYCGFGPDYCGTGCQSGCGRKSDCNPGTWNSTIWSKSETCPLNVCCSKHGFCGMTKDFCGDKQVKRPSCNIADTPITRVIGYWEAWSKNRPCMNMFPEQIPYGFYTDIIFSFATIDPVTFELKAGDDKTADYMERISTIKLLQPDIRIWVAVGGWAFNDEGPTQWTFSDIAGSEANTKAFVSSAVRLMNRYGFDGIDIDWEYPVDTDRFGRPADYANFVSLMKAVAETMRSGISGRRRLVSLTLPASFWYLQHFDIVGLEPYVDWYNMMTYDMHGSWDIKNDWTGPYANSHTNMTEIQDALDLLWRNNVNPSKVTFGAAYYSRTFTLENAASCNGPKCRVVSGGVAGRCSETTGVLLHAEIQEEMKAHNAVATLDRTAMVKTVSWGDQWTSFDDTATWRLKLNAIRSQCIPGVMVWAMSQDDAKGTNIAALTAAAGRKQMTLPPGLSGISAPKPEPVTVTNPPRPKLCRWSGCYADCPAGFKTVRRDGHPEIMAHSQHCMKGYQTKLCCPADEEMPKCTWRGHRNSGICKPGCEEDEVAIGSLGDHCRQSHQKACCTKVPSTAPYGECKWTGTAPSCNNKCPGDYPHKITESRRGAGGEKECTAPSTKSYCCKDPPPLDFQSCHWVRKATPPALKDKDIVCEDVCPEGEFKLLSSTDGCFAGAKAYCCRPVVVWSPPVTPDDDEDDEAEDKIVGEFRRLLKRYMEDPTCPADELGVVPPTDLYRDPGFNSARKKRAESLDVLRQLDARQSGTCSLTMELFRTIKGYVRYIIASPSPLPGMSDVWDDEVAGHYDFALQAASLRKLHADNPNLDPDALVDRILGQPLTAATEINVQRQMSTVLCQNPNAVGVMERRGEDQSAQGKELEARRLWWLEHQMDRASMPSVQAILHGIFDGDLTLHYARWRWYNGQGHNAGPMLELAYWIGREPGVAPPAAERANFDQYRDNPGDRWVVFHLHIQPNARYAGGREAGLSWLHYDAANQRTHIGVHAVQVYHGYRAENNGDGYNQWRVANRQIGAGQRNERQLFQCPSEEPLYSLWMVGLESPFERPELQDALWMDPTSPTGRLYHAMRRWGRELYESGLVSSLSLRRIMVNPRLLPGPDGRSTQVDPLYPGNFAATNDETWDYNFLIDEEDGVVLPGVYPNPDRPMGGGG